MSRLRLALSGKRDPWTPYAIPLGLRCLWLSARDHGSGLMTDDGAGLISNITGRNIVGQSLGATLTARPFWDPLGMGGVYPALMGNAVAAMASASALSLPTVSDPLTLIALAQSSVAAGQLISYGGTGAGTLRRLASSASNVVIASNGTTTTTVGGATGAARTWATPVIAVASWAADLTLSIRADGGASTGTTTMASNNTGTTRTRLLSGNGASATAIWTGPFSELIGLRASLADALPYVQKIEGWMAWNATSGYPLLNLAANFPADHPYKGAAP